jgi:hypothetical protein
MRFSVVACAILSVGLAFAPVVPASADDTGMAASLHTLKREGKKVCLDGHFHSGSSAGVKDKKAALAEAIKSWAGFTAFEYGTDWANWSKAANKSANCSQGASGWGCSIEARPCK